MKKPLFWGVSTALVTPFLDGCVNYPLMEQLIRRQMDAGIHSLVLAGTTGEAPTLSDVEKFELFHRSKKYVGNDCQIIAGTGTNSTKRAIEMSIAAEKAGVDAVLVVAPYYNKGNAEGLYNHFVSIANAVSIPVIVYNVPSRTGVDIPVSVYKQLSYIENIAGVKEASADITKITKIRNSCNGALPVWSGNDDQIVPVLSLGGCGVISVLSNVLPAETVAMTQAALDGDFDTAAAIQCQLQPLIDLLFCEVNPIPVKYAMKHVGFDCGGYRLPLASPQADTIKKIDAYFSK